MSSSHSSHSSDSDSSSADPICVICIEQVSSKLTRSTATLVCGHKYHLDCIGSLFNYRGGVMICPYCRSIEHGNWLFAASDDSDDEILDVNIDFDEDIRDEDDEYEEYDEYDQYYEDHDVVELQTETLHRYMQNGFPDRLPRRMIGTPQPAEPPRSNPAAILGSLDQLHQNDWVPQVPQPVPVSTMLSISLALSHGPHDWAQMNATDVIPNLGAPSYPNQLGIGGHAAASSNTAHQTYHPQWSGRTVVRNTRVGQQQASSSAAAAIPPAVYTQTMDPASRHNHQGYGPSMGQGAQQTFHNPGSVIQPPQQTSGYFTNLLQGHRERNRFPEYQFL